MRLLVLALALGTAAQAQSAETAPPAGWWGGYTAGVVRTVDVDSRSGLLASHLYLRTPYGVGPVRVEGGAGVAFDLFGSESVADVRLALASNVAAGPLLLSVAGGPALVAATRPSFLDPGFADDQGKVLPGLHGSARVVLVIVPPFGIGVEAFGLTTEEVSYTGVGVSLSFGRLPARAAIRNPPPRPRPAR